MSVQAQTPDVLALLKQKADLVETELAKYLPSPQQATTTELKEYYQMLWAYPHLGGKRLRPAICMLSCEMFGGNPSDTLPSAVAMDLFQHWVLIHDDIEDGSELRRGKPCLHRAYGIEKAINAGDGLHNYMWKVLLANKALIGPTKTHKVFEEFVRQVEITAEGQAIEIGWNMSNRWDVTETEYLDMIERKTVHYTTSTPLRLGAMIAGAKARDLEVLRKVGLKAGYAFQIMDDALNLYADPDKYGKEIGGDILEGKRTMIMLHLLGKAKKEKERILEIMRKPREQKTEQEVEEVLALLRNYGSIDYAQKKARGYAEQAIELFNKKLTHVPGKEAHQALGALIYYLATRDK